MSAGLLFTVAGKHFGPCAPTEILRDSVKGFAWPASASRLALCSGSFALDIPAAFRRLSDGADREVELRDGKGPFFEMIEEAVGVPRGQQGAP